MNRFAAASVVSVIGFLLGVALFYITSNTQGDSPFREEGIASWYGEDYHGNYTANQEIFSMKAMTAAHKTLPYNTFVRVTDQETEKEIVVRINDRGPFVEGRIIDLSKAAAGKLGMINKGITPVIVEVIQEAP